MAIIRQSKRGENEEVVFAKAGQTNWQGFVLTGLPDQYREYENRPVSLSTAITIWNRVVPLGDRLKISEVSASLIHRGTIH